MPVETKLHTEPIGGGEPIAELPAEIISYGYRLNRPGSISFRLALDHPLCTRDNVGDQTEAVVTRNKAVVWRGPIDTPNETDEKGNRTVEFGGEGLESYARQWHVTSTLTYADVDQLTIARGLVAHHQGKAGGDFGIDTSAVNLSGVTRDRTYLGFELKNVYEALVELAEVDDGFDWHINPADRELVLHYPRRGSRKPDLIWDERTIRKFGRTIDRKAQASQVLGVGAGEGDDMLRRSFQDASAVAEHKLTQRIYTNKDVSVQATLDGHVRRELSLTARPPEQFSITVGTTDPPIFSYQLGDEGQLRWPSPYDPVNRFMRLVGFDVTWTQGEEQAVLHLQEVIT